jgi:hypothetical protein
MQTAYLQPHTSKWRAIKQRISRRRPKDGLGTENTKASGFFPGEADPLL